MTKITFDIDDTKLPRIVDTMKGLYPIPQIDDPQNPGQMIPQFTDNQWPREVIRKFVIQQVARYEQLKAQKAIKYNLDDTIVS